MKDHPFFILLRSGLWGIPAETSSFSSRTIDWNHLKLMAQSQNLTALVFDGIETLPAELRPPTSIYTEWMSEVKAIEHENKLLNQALTKLFTLYQKSGLTPILLQGQGIATTYRHPLHHQGEGVDIYLDKEEYEAGNRLLREQNMTWLEEKIGKYTRFLSEGICITNYQMPTYFSCPISNIYFQRIVSQWYPLTTRGVLINKYRIALPPPSFNALYISVHTLIQFFSDRINLQQLCDWVRLLHTENEHIERTKLRHQLRSLGMMAASSAFGHIAVHYLGLPLRELPVYMDKKIGEALLQQVLRNEKSDFRELQQLAPRETYWHQLRLFAQRFGLKCSHIQESLFTLKRANNPKKALTLHS